MATSVVYEKVIRDVRDASRDLSLPQEMCRALYTMGVLSRDLNNGAYLTARTTTTLEDLERAYYKTPYGQAPT